jgi:hypothetical protein
MSQLDFIVSLFCAVHDVIPEESQDPRSLIAPSELVTIAILYAMKNLSQRRFVLWFKANFLPLFPKMPERTRLFRLMRMHQDLTDRFLAKPTLIGFCDSFGIETIHPRREGRSAAQFGKKGISNHRWIVGIKFCPLLNGRGEIIDWDADTANVYDGTFQRMIKDYEEEMLVLVDSGFHQSKGDCSNLGICRRGQCNVRMAVETFFSQLRGLFGKKHLRERSWEGMCATLAYMVACYNVLLGWSNQGNESGKFSLAMAQYVI